MLYSKFIYHAKEKAIQQLDNGEWYLEPEWRDILAREVLDDLEKLEDAYVYDWWDIENILELEVKKRNSGDEKKKAVINWLYDLIVANVEPAVMAEETEFIKNMTEYLKVAHTGDTDGDLKIAEEANV